MPSAKAAIAAKAWTWIAGGVIIVVMAACWLAFLLASRIDKLLGITGNAVLSRLLGVILAALAVQYVIDGLRTAFGA
jgi:multiple antibiotic resistance protein